MNEKQKKRELDFVLHYYQEGRLDGRKAFRAWSRRVGIGRTVLFRRVVRYAVAACLLLALGASVFVYQWWQENRSVELVADARLQVCRLPDGTVVTLSPHATLSYNPGDFKTGKRAVVLKGTAYFEVTHNPQTPFSVTTQYARVKVLGTRFQVQESGRETRAWVRDGRVLFASSAHGGGVVLTRGMEAVLSHGSSVPRRVTPSLNPEAWRTGSFVYNDAPLEKVLEELSRYYGVRLTASEPDRRLTATLPADDLERVVRMIETSLNIRIKR